MKQITFRELLNLIHEGKQPNKVHLIGTKTDWEWDSNDEEYYYINFNNGYTYTEDTTLEEVVSDFYNAKQLAEEKIISFCEEILDDKEKEYLSNIIRPFKKYVRAVSKIKIGSQEQINILYYDYFDKGEDVYSFILLPTFKKDTMYRGMESYKEYTLEELGL